MAGPAFTVIVRCADPRVDGFFSDEASRARLGLAPGAEPLSEAFLGNVGGALPFVDQRDRLARDISLLMDLFGEGRGRVLLTAHSQCGGYAAALDVSKDEIDGRQRRDLESLAEYLVGQIEGVSVDAYYLHIEDGRIERIV